MLKHDVTLTRQTIVGNQEPRNQVYLSMCLHVTVDAYVRSKDYT